MNTNTKTKKELIHAINELELQVARQEKAKELLQENVKRYYTIFTHSPLGIVHFDVDGIILDVNIEFVRIIGSSREALIGFNLLKQLNDEKTLSAVREALKGGTGNYEGIYHSVTCSKVTPVRGLFVGLPDDNGRITGGTGIFEDITDQKQAEESLKDSFARNKAMLDAIPDLMFVFDADCRFVDYHAEKSVNLYTDPELFLGKKPEEVLPPDIGIMTSTRVKEILRTGQPDYDTYDLLIGGDLRHFESRGALYGNDHVLSIVRDITDMKRAAEVKRVSEERFWSILNASPDNITITDLKGNVLMASPVGMKLFGYEKEEELKGLPVTDFIIPSDKERALSNIAFMFQGILTGPAEYHGLRKDGSVFYIEANAEFIRDANGQPDQIVFIIRDITERKRAEDELRKLSLAVKQSPASILITDTDGNIVYANPKVCLITGYSPEELRGKNPRIFQSGETPQETYMNLWETIYSGKEWKGEFHNKKKNGELYWEFVSISPIIDNTGKITEFLAVKEDITEWKKMIASLEQAKEKAEASNRLKTAFMNNISHEVRTPLNGILGFSSLISQPDNTEEEKAQFYSLIKTSSSRLLRTITNYMDISLIASGNLEVRRKSFDFHRMLYQLYDEFQPHCAEKNLELHFDIPAETLTIKMFSDPELIQNVISHLLDNALTFTNKGEITFGYKRKSGSIEFFVKDTGIGINPESLLVIFESFVQGEISPSGFHSGSGLGLSIAQGYIRLLGGEIRVESEEGRGSAFFFSIPDSGLKEDAATADIIDPEYPVQANPVILIAEDDTTNVLLTQAMLKDTGVTVLVANNGEAAVSLCKDHQEITLVLMDLKMPVLGGIEATLQIKSFRKDLPVIAVTAYALSEDEKTAIEAGCSDFLAKPFEKDVLFRKLKRYGILF